ncbi:hypothetical protein ACVW19_006898 [Streptomyces sp. TE5632]
MRSTRVGRAVVAVPDALAAAFLAVGFPAVRLPGPAAAAFRGEGRAALSGSAAGLAGAGVMPSACYMVTSTVWSCRRAVNRS